MKNWIAPTTTLTGETVELVPLAQQHFAELMQLAKDKRIWEFYILDGTDSARFAEILEEAMIEKEKGTQFPFVIVHKPTNSIIGSTRFLDIQPKHKKLEIGWTWLNPDHWATAVNIECKLLLLTFCFEKIEAVRVQLKTDEKNVRSRKAIEKIGGQYEGILRKEMVRDNGTYRSSAYFSILDEEWGKVKPMLTEMYREKKGTGVIKLV